MRHALGVMMRLVFSSSDITEIGRVGREFIAAGIPCGIRYDPPGEGVCPTPAHAELWIQHENDFQRAVMLYACRDGSPEVGRSDSPNHRVTQEAPVRRTG